MIFKYLIGISVVLTATNANAAIVTTTFSGLLDQASGEAYAGQLFVGQLSYDDASAPQFLDPDFVEYGGADLSYTIGSGDTQIGGGLPAVHLRYGPATSGLSFFGPGDSLFRGSLTLNLGRTDPTNIALPTLAEILYKPARFTFDQPLFGPGGITGYAGGEGDAIIGTVPEPATWALMIGGMGLIGGTMRRRKPTVAVTYA